MFWELPFQNMACMVDILFLCVYFIAMVSISQE